jgi:hypothetical protein
VKQRIALFLCLIAPVRAFCGEDTPSEPLVIGPRHNDTPRQDSFKIRSELQHIDFERVKAAAQTLAASGDRRAIPLLWNLFNAGDGERRVLAVRAIGKIGGQGEEENLLRVALGDVFQNVRFAAAEELARIESVRKAVERFNAAASDTKRFSLIGRFRAIQAIGQIGGPAASKALVPWLASDEAELACAAAEGLGRQTGLDRCPDLMKALSHKQEDARIAAADALENLTGKKFRFDLLQWQEWLAARAAAKPEEPGAQSPSEAPEAPFAPVEIGLREELVDLVVVFDTTGSMTNIWPQLSNAIDGVLGELQKSRASLRVATIKYRAASPNAGARYTILPKPFSRNIQMMRDDLQDASFGGGSGGLHVGLRHAFNGLHWRAQSRKLVIIVGDTSPEGNGLAECVGVIRDAWRMDGILVNTLFVRTAHGEEHLQSYLRMARAGAGRMYEYNKAEKHLVDLTAEKVSVRIAELFSETAKKLCAPVKR